MNKKMKIVSLICAAVMLAGCSGNNANIGGETNFSSEAPVLAAKNMSAKTAENKSVSALDTADDTELYIPKDDIGENMINYLTSEFACEDAKTNIMPDENAKKLEEAIRNIRINNSRFALPLMIKDLPQGFSIEIADGKKEEIVDNFFLYMGTLFMGDERCAETLVILKDGAEEKYGIIVSISLFSEKCKWSFGDIEFFYDYNIITQNFGDPLSYGAFSELLGIVCYVTKNNDYVGFYDGLYGVLCCSFNMDNIAENALLTEYVPYDDFDGIPEIPELTGDPREIDWSKIFDEDCIVIGNEKYPSLTRIGDMGEDFNIIQYTIGKDFSQDGSYLKDTYTMMYKGRIIGYISALRQKDEPLDDALIFGWSFALDQITFPTAVMNIPLSQDFNEISKIYKPNAQKDFGCRYMGIVETDKEEYMCTLSLISSLAFWSVTPVSADPEIYEDFLERMNAQ